MPGGAKKGKSTDGGKESPEKEKDPNAKHKSGKNPPMTKTMSGHSTDGHHSGHHHHHHHHQQQPDMKQQTQQHHSHHHHHHHGSHPQPHEQAKNVEASSTTSAK
ncbi:uncharacterized histidine-rich protein DDB_G0274557-like isoform X2 [Neocloeon triangulifer]|uniref:uncharacterized histidine-rich protein DDB_G0274557-like isoform X2 n=1 Tax=Neocloeon triangulifer TaxID=2078957 RepID=UPI00286F8615|nr:uncharacterized histidine-rich protein DDB_G0274557-like isoform X2 [Neocloeon triangulifer]